MVDMPAARGLLLLAIALAVLVGVVLANSLLFRCRQLEVGSPAAIPVDGTGVAERLAQAVRFKTISYQEPQQFNPEPFVSLRDFLERSYPNVHRALTREIVNDYSGRARARRLRAFVM